MLLCKWKPSVRKAFGLLLSGNLHHPFIFCEAGLFWPYPMPVSLFDGVCFLRSFVIYFLIPWWDVQSLGTNMLHLTWKFWNPCRWFLLPPWASHLYFWIKTLMEMLNSNAGSDPPCRLLKDVLMAILTKWWFTELKTGNGCNQRQCEDNVPLLSYL